MTLSSECRLGVTVLKRIRQLSSRIPVVYEFGALLRLLWLRLRYSGGGIISAILLTRPNQGVAVDIGANRGQSAIRMAILRPEFTIVAFEPNKRCEVFLRITQMMLGHRFSFHLLGLSDHKATMTYYEPFIHRLAVPAEGTFLPENLSETLRTRIGDNLSVRKTEFPVVTLDEFHLAPDFIKIDVQGSELDVLRGGTETILRSRPVLVVEKNENNLDEVKSYLEGLGYQALDGDSALARSVALDITEDNVFVHESYLAMTTSTSNVFGSAIVKS